MNRSERRVLMQMEKRNFEEFFKKIHPEWPESGFKTSESVDGFEYNNAYVKGVWRGWWGKTVKIMGGL